MASPDDPAPPPAPQQPRQPRFGLFAFLALVGFALIAGDLFSARHGADSVPYSRFLSMVDEGRVSEVTVSVDRISGTLKDPTPGQPKEFVTTRVEDPELVKRLNSKGVRFSGTREGGILLGMLSW